jgi:HAD superfamily hydrolase (TIGR01509 family)
VTTGPLALIFDVDGTLADTEELHRQSFNAAFAQFGLGWNWPREVYRKLLDVTGGKERINAYIAGLPLPASARDKLRALVPAVHAAKTRLYTDRVAEGGAPLRDGVARLLDEAAGHGCRLAIASTTTAANVGALLSATPGCAGLFEVIACGDEVPAKKPSPDIYRLALQRLRLDARDVVAFEDSEHGLCAAVAAGLWTVVTPSWWTEGGDYGAAGLVLPHLGDPSRPLPGEPGSRLAKHAWLTFGELQRLRTASMAP